MKEITNCPESFDFSKNKNSENNCYTVLSGYAQSFLFFKRTKDYGESMDLEYSFVFVIF